MKVSVLRYAAIGMATLSMAGFAAASSVDVNHTGPDSNNRVLLHNSLSESLRNNNRVGVGNVNFQGANSGDVQANSNTSVEGGANSGDASNGNSAVTHVTVDNSGSGFGLGSLSAPSSDVTVSTTGPDSNNEVNISNKAKLSQTNNNSVEVLNLSFQGASSGDVQANHNTTVSGGVSSGDASNTNSSTTTVDVSN